MSGAGTLSTSCSRTTAPATRAVAKRLSRFQRNYFDTGGKLVALLGVKDLVVVDTPDALLVADRRRAQQVGDIVKLLEAVSGTTCFRLSRRDPPPRTPSSNLDGAIHFLFRDDVRRQKTQHRVVRAIDQQPACMASSTICLREWPVCTPIIRPGSADFLDEAELRARAVELHPEYAADALDTRAGAHRMSRNSRPTRQASAPPPKVVPCMPGRSPRRPSRCHDDSRAATARRSAWLRQ